jgi:hypothetical protein
MSSHQLLDIDRPIIVHDDVSESTELRSPKGLGKEISNHFVSGTIGDYDLIACLNVSNEEVSDVHVTCFLAA